MGKRNWHKEAIAAVNFLNENGGSEKVFYDIMQKRHDVQVCITDYWL